MNKQTVKIAMASDDNYINLLIIALTSVIMNSSSNVHCYILTTGFSSENLAKLEKLKKLGNSEFSFEIITIKENDFKEFPKVRKLGLMTNARLKIHRFIPDIDKILYLDCDIVAIADIAECFNHEFANDELFGACMDYVSPQKAERIKVDYHSYFNAGILLMNLKKMREINFSKLCGDCLSDETLTVKNDQDLLNAVTSRANLKWLRLAAHWNVFADVSFRKIKKTKLYHNELYLIKEALQSPKIIHYTGIKPTTYNYRARFKNIFWDYVRKSPIADLSETDKNFKNFILKYFSTPKLQRKFRSLTKRLR
ncbi:glycosyltransferase family 8 protein [Lentisphaerota bacterium WC36G]|nr:glycosyltransferase family 8 protein [Lentisphaerae bacterium WC36]